MKRTLNNQANWPDEQLARLREALDEFRRSPVTLPDGKSYGERVRALDRRRQVELDRERSWRPAGVLLETP